MTLAEENVAIPKPVLDGVETLDEPQDWLTANNPRLVAELRDARREDIAGVMVHRRFEPVRSLRDRDVCGRGDRGWRSCLARPPANG